MGKWLTKKSPIIQSDTSGEFITTTNQLYRDDDGTIYLVPRNTSTDGYSIPLGINRTKYGVRPATLHDIGCRYHKLIIVNLPLYRVVEYLDKDIPIEYLKVVDCKFNSLNNLFYRAMVDDNIPSAICRLYRIGVQLNIGYISTGKDNIDINSIYNNILYT